MTNHYLNRISVRRLILSLVLLTGCASQPRYEQPLSTQPSETANVIPTVAGEGQSTTREVDMFILSSSAFSDEGFIPDKYTYKLGRQCSGENYSPPLEWKGVPEGTESLLLTVIDPDGGNWVHWLLANIPADARSLPEEIGGPPIGISGRNDFGGIGYGGPCPPSGTHRYVFTLYALDTSLDVKPGVTYKSILPLYQDHILGKTVLTGKKQAK